MKDDTAECRAKKGLPSTFHAHSSGAADEIAVRIDKWLWAARFYKTRGLAQAAVIGGKVKVNGERVKPAKSLAPGDRLAIRIGEFEWSIAVKALSDRRGPAETARQLYEEEEASRALRIAQVADRRAQAARWGERKGRPTKRERREIDRWRGAKDEG
jgi:ribosome-associated heat shock protein Hsp15